MNTPWSKNRILWTVFIFVLPAFVGRCSDLGTDKILISGSTTIHPIMEMVISAYQKNNDGDIILRPNGTVNGLQDLAEGRCDIATASSKISPAILKDIRAGDTDLKEFVFAYDMIVPIVHPKNPIENLTLEQLRKIYDGNIASWDAVGGSGTEILVVTRDRSSGTGEVWNRIVMESNEVRIDHQAEKSNSGVLAFVSKHPNAIGYISFGYTNNEIKVVSINGAFPTLKNGKNSGYPVRRSLYLYVDEKNLSFGIKSFIIYLLSSEGQDLVRKSGFIPLYPLSLKQQFNSFY